MSNLPAIESVIAGMAWTCSISLIQPLLQVMHTTFAFQFKWLETQFLRLIMSKYVFGPGNRAIHSLQTCSPDSLACGCAESTFFGHGLLFAWGIVRSDYPCCASEGPRPCGRCARRVR